MRMVVTMRMTMRMCDSLLFVLFFVQNEKFKENKMRDLFGLLFVELRYRFF